MSQTIKAEIDVEALKSSIRDAAAQRAEDVERFAATFAVTASTGLRRNALFDHESSWLPPRQASEKAATKLELQFAEKDHYHVDELLKYHDKDFVAAAYNAILKREPDETGAAHILESLQSGHFNKIDVLASLRYSVEGEQKKVRLDGLRWPSFVRRLGRVPFFGYALQLIVAVARLPVAVRHRRQFEAHALLQHRELAEHVEFIKSQIVKHVSMSETQVDEHLNRFAVAQQHAALKWRKTQNTVHAWMSAADEGLKRQAETLTQALEERTQQLAERQRQTEMELTQQRTCLVSLLDEARQRLPERFNEQQLQTLATEANDLLDEFYVRLQDRFRGERADIKNRLQVYLPFLAQAEIKNDILDVGCGRGEWLELLCEHGVAARGVDTNRLMLEGCRQRGFDVVEADAVDYLSSLPDHSLSAITSFHLVEHLPFRVLLRFLDQSLRVLKPGGLLILETPNPENLIVGSCGFYLDPTHKRPLPGLLMKFLLEARSFERVEIIKLNPLTASRIPGNNALTATFNDFFFGHMDYAAIGRKPTAVTTATTATNGSSAV